jgi:uncharacterized protein
MSECHILLTMITREEALELIEKHHDTQTDINHYLESEAIMGALALKLGEDVEYWKMLGLLHDVDWGMTKSNPKDHLTKAPEILREAGFDDKFIQTVVSHGYGFECAGLEDMIRTELVQHALAASETLTGLIHAYALMRDGRISDMKAKGLKKKFKDKKFAAAIKRDVIRECEKIGMELNDFFVLSIAAIVDIKDEVGLL